METKHTQGEWTANYDESRSEWTVDGESNSVCTVDSPAEFAEGDAKILAASKDLLEALKECLTDLEVFIPKLFNLNAAKYSAVIKAKAAIQKATT